MTRVFKGALSGALLLGLFVLATNVPAFAKTVVVPELMCPTKCGTLVADEQFANELARHGAPVSLAPQETPGYMYNIRYMNNNYDKPATKSTAFGAAGWVLMLAPTGGHGILKNSLPQPVTHHFQYLSWQATAATGQFFVTFDPTIKTVQDLKGKRVDIGLLSQSGFGLTPLMILHAAGITAKNTKIRNLTPVVLATQLINGAADAVVVGTLGNPVVNKWAPEGPLVRLFAAAQASGKTLHFVSVTPALMKTVDKEYGTGFYTTTLKPHTLSATQNEPVTVGLARAFRAVARGFPEKDGYELTKAFLKYGPDLRKEGGLWSFWSAKSMVSGLTACNTNPGAIEAYKQAGVWKDRKTVGPPSNIPGC